MRILQALVGVLVVVGAVSIVLIAWSAWRLYQEQLDTQQAISSQQHVICQLAQNTYFTQIAIAHHLGIDTPAALPPCQH